MSKTEELKALVRKQAREIVAQETIDRKAKRNRMINRARSQSAGC
jgi:hypothetical protein